MQVSCQREREREKNRFIALRTLVEKIELAMSGSPGAAERDDDLARAQKQRARRRRRSRAANTARAAAGADDRFDAIARTPPAARQTRAAIASPHARCVPAVAGRSGEDDDAELDGASEAVGAGRAPGLPDADAPGGPAGPPPPPH